MVLKTNLEPFRQPLQGSTCGTAKEPFFLSKSV